MGTQVIRERIDVNPIYALAHYFYARAYFPVDIYAQAYILTTTKRTAGDYTTMTALLAATVTVFLAAMIVACICSAVMGEQ
jgi:hypothetical protein